jgi:hypothetical protein
MEKKALLLNFKTMRHAVTCKRQVQSRPLRRRLLWVKLIAQKWLIVTMRVCHEKHDHGDCRRLLCFKRMGA